MRPNFGVKEHGSDPRLSDVDRLERLRIARILPLSLGGGARARPWLDGAYFGDVLVTARPLYGYGPPPLAARADETALSMAVTAETAASRTDRNFMKRRWGIPGSFPGRAWAPREAYPPRMRLSTIAKQSTAGNGSDFSRVLGEEIRRRRVALGLSQTYVGRPLSRAFVSSVESGRLTPSLASLLMIARRLNSSAGTILASVETQLEGGTTDESADQTTIPR